MGLLDSVLGSFGSGGGSGPSSTSPLVKALLVLLAAKAVSSHFGGSPTATSAPSGSTSAPQSKRRIESGMMAGLPSLDSILDRLRGSGHEETVKSWIAPGENKPLPPQEVPLALGPEAIDQLQKQTGLPRNELLQQISQALPQIVDKLTPDGRLPPSSERSHW